MAELFRRPASRYSKTAISCWGAAAVALLMVSTPARSAPGDEMYLHPGQLVAADGGQLNLYCTGKGSPTVLFYFWSIRIGLLLGLWSSPRSPSGRAPAALTDPATASVLWDRCRGPANVFLLKSTMRSVLLASAVLSYVLVGHAFGATNMRTFADLYPDEVKGLVLIDPDPIDAGTPDQIATAHRFYIRQAIEI